MSDETEARFVDSEVQSLLLDDQIQLPIAVEAVDPKRGRKFGNSNLLIAGYSNEERWKSLFHQVPRDRTILLCDQTGPIWTGQSSQLLVVNYDRFDPRPAVGELLGLISKPVQTITLDISTLPTPLYYLLLKALVESRLCEKLVVAYTEPASYPQEDLTYGYSHIEPIPGFYGSFDPGKQTLLVALLGFEGRRTLAVFREVAPDFTVAVNGVPGFKPGYDIRSFQANMDFLVASGAIERMLTAPANHPVIVLKRLLSLYDKYSESYNLYIAPLGTKPLGLAACLLALLRGDVKVIYHYPTSSNDAASLGIGRSWLYHFSVESFLKLAK